MNSCFSCDLQLMSLCTLYFHTIAYFSKCVMLLYRYALLHIAQMVYILQPHQLKQL